MGLVQGEKGGRWRKKRLGGRGQLLPEVSGSIGRANGEAQMTQNGPPDELIVVCSRLLAQAKSLVFQEVRGIEAETGARFKT